MVEDDKWYLTLSNKTGENAAYTLTRTDTDTEYPAVGEGKFEIDNADITGSIMVRMDAKVDKGSYTDITRSICSLKGRDSTHDQPG